MLNLCNFVDKRTVAILSKPTPQLAEVLINVNRQIASGLLTNPNQQQGHEGGQHQADSQDRSRSEDISI